MPNQLANIHDAFFKQVLGDPHLAGTFLASCRSRSARICPHSATLWLI
jgi:hypothetical protein